jgi:hypothetical protein
MAITAITPTATIGGEAGRRILRRIVEINGKIRNSSGAASRA